MWSLPSVSNHESVADIVLVVAPNLKPVVLLATVYGGGGMTVGHEICCIHLGSVLTNYSWRFLRDRLWNWKLGINPIISTSNKASIYLLYCQAPPRKWNYKQKLTHISVLCHSLPKKYYVMQTSFTIKISICLLNVINPTNDFI